MSGELPADRWQRELWLTAILFALSTALVLSKAAIAWRDNNPIVPLDNVPLEALAGSGSGFLVLSVLVLIGWVASRSRWGMGTVWLLALAYLLLTLLNLCFAAKFGRPFSLSWLSYAYADNAVALKRYLSSALTMKLVLAMGLVVVAALCAMAVVRWARLRLAAPILLILTLAGTGLSWVAIALSPTPGDHPVARKVRDEPLISQLLDYRARWHLAAAADWSEPREWAARGFAAREIGGVRPNIIVLVADSVSASTFEKQAANGELPNLSAFRARGRSIPVAYTPTPTSAKAYLAMQLSDYPDLNSFGSNAAYIAPYATPFTDVLRAGGYRTGMFMSGSLANYGIADFLARHPFDIQHDNGSLECRGAEWRRRIYDHPGDDCLITAAVDWIVGGEQSWFAWMWLNGTHYPYYAPDNPRDPSEGTPELRHANALREIDRVFGIVLERLEKAGQLQNTFILFLSDHGEAFGEHGDWLHGTSVYDEQVRVPFIVGPLPQGGDIRDLDAASLIDVGPTVLDAAGLAQERPVAGRSLFRAPPGRAIWFASKGGGNIVGFRQGDIKTIYDYRDASVRQFDLKTDPGELAPKTLTGPAEGLALSRIRAFVDDRGL